MRFGQNVLRIAWKARFVQFSWKAYCFHLLALISVLWAILGFGTLKNAIWAKRPPHGLKSTFCTMFIESLLFSRIGVNFSPVERFLAQKRWEMRFGQNVLRIAWKARFVQFSSKAYLFSPIGVKFSPLEWILALKRWEMRFGQNVLSIAGKARFEQFSLKAYCFYVLAWIFVP